MDNRSNTIAGWVLGAGIVALGASIVTGEMFHDERPETMGYPIEGVANPDDDSVAEAPIAALLATADPAKGEAVFARCKTCHTVNKGGSDLSGPNLWGTVGSPVGHVPGFPYTPDFKAIGGSWDWEKLSQWVKDPKSLAKGTKMGFAGLGKPEDRANLLAYLNTQSDSPLPLPSPPATSPAKAAAEKSDAPAGGKAEDEPVLTEQKAARQPEGRVQGEGAPQTSGREGQAKTKSE
jgi:cytochrome c